ncbi:hypothetical protein [Streptomyces sp. NPDC003635]
MSTLLSRAGKRTCGEFSALPRPVWGQGLSALTRHQVGVSCVELSDATLVDAVGVTALSVPAMNLPDGRMVLARPPRHLLTVEPMLGPGLNRIEVAPR